MQENDVLQIKPEPSGTSKLNRCYRTDCIVPDEIKTFR